jgi:beta-glucanase (GH16 family)
MATVVALEHMDASVGQGNVRVGSRRRAARRTSAVAVASLVVLAASALTAIVPAPEAGAASQARLLYNGGRLSAISADGCSLKPIRLSTTPLKTRRDYQCVTKSTAPSTATTGTVRMNNGDILSVVAADGCALKVKRLTTIPARYRRDVQCVIKGVAAPPGNTPPGNSPPPSTPPPASPPAGQPPASVTGGAVWRGIWSDDFNGTAVDASKWNVPNNSNFGSGNNEDHCYLRSNVVVSGGTLKLTGRRQSVTNCGANPNGGSTYFFTSGMVTSRAQGGSLKMKYRYGYLEAQMKVPRGNIYWPAFWLAGPGDGSTPGWPAYGEVDISEIYGSKPDISESNFHRTGGNIGARNHNVNSPPSTASGKNVNPPNAFVAGGVNNWHRYGLKWTPNTLQWFIDGVLVRTFTGTTNNDLSAIGYEKSIILNLAMGGNGPRYPDHGYTGQEAGGTYNNGNLVADLPGTMEIDYVRLWQQ